MPLKSFVMPRRRVHDELVDDLAERDGRERQEVEHQFRRRDREHRADQGRERRRDEHREQYRQAEVVVEDRRAVRADRVERRVAERNLAAVAEQYVQPRHRDDVELYDTSQHERILGAADVERHAQRQEDRDRRDQLFPEAVVCKRFLHFCIPPQSSWIARSLNRPVGFKKQERDQEDVGDQVL